MWKKKSVGIVVASRCVYPNMLLNIPVTQDTFRSKFSQTVSHNNRYGTLASNFCPACDLHHVPPIILFRLLPLP
jgi:hypothetical protein